MNRLVTLMLKPFGQIKRSEYAIVFLMFLYSFLLMAAFAVIKPATRSKFIDDLGPLNMPYVQLVTGAIIGLVMTSYSWLVSRFPGRLRLILSQAFIAVVLIVFWFLFRTDAAHPTLHYFQKGVSAAFYLLGLILALLLLSQFWALANIIFDPRQAKRLFGFIGGGSSLGGILGSCLASVQMGTDNLLLISAGFMVLSIVPVGMIIRRQGISEEMQEAVANAEKGISGKEAIRMFRKSKHLRLIAFVISFAAIGACIIDQQLNMAVAAMKGQQGTEAITVFLAKVQFWTSVAGFLVQILLTSRIHQRLGIGFALILLPFSCGTSAIIILLVKEVLWAPGLARVLDQSLRYTIDKTSREVLYMPLPSDVKFAAKPFIDVTVDRLARSLGAILLLFLIKPWGLAIGWKNLSYASIVIAGVWIWMALRTRQGYKEALRESINTREIKPAEVTVAAADLPIIESLIQELASPDEQRVLYAIDFLESLNKKHLITPLLLYHESPAVRARSLSVMRMIQPEISARWLPAIQAMMADSDPNVRSEAVAALASMHAQEATDLVRLLLRDKNPRISLTAAMMLAGSGEEEDAARAEEVINGLISDTRESAAPVRRDFAIAIRQAPIPHFRRLLIPLLNDPDPEVAEEAMRSTRRLGATDFVFIPTLISLLRDRRQKSNARELLVGFGERALPILSHFLRDPGEDLWIRRHIPGTIARNPCQKAMNILVDALDEKDGFLRFHVIAALEKIHRIKPELSFNRSRIESLIQEESARYTQHRRLHRILLQSQSGYRESLVARAIVEKMKRGVDRIYRLLSLLYPWKEIAASRDTIEHGDARSRAGTIEYLDNLLAGRLRKSLIPLLEDAHLGEDSAIGGANSVVQAAILSLINDEDPVVASAAIYFVWQQRLSSFIDELDRILATRDPQDRLVLETASWALQELHMPAPKRRLIWLDPLPSVNLANQMSSLPLFGSVTVDEIFRICDMGRQVRSEPGRVICQEALVPENVQFLLNGHVAVTRSGGESRQIESPAVLAFQEVLEERPMAESVQAADMTVCLTLTSEELQVLLADNSNLVPGLFQMLCRDSQAGRAVVKGRNSPRSALPDNGNFNAIEKGLVLKNIPVFSQVSPEEIIALASVAAEMQLTAGSDLFTETDPPAIYALISGEVSIEGSTDSPITAGPFDVIGIYETLAGIGFRFHARIRQNGIALRIEHEDLFDLLVQRSTLLRQVLGALFRSQPGKQLLDYNSQFS
jgi:ATP:ADP antiporter, AAA family